MPYFIVFDKATGQVRWRAEGDPAIQVLPDGLAALGVPQAAIVGADIDLAAIRPVLLSKIDAEADAEALKFISPGTSRAMIYQAKAAEARAYVADNSTPTPFLTAEAAATGVTVAALAATVVAQANAWITIGAKIEAARMAAKKAIKAATDLGAMHNAAQIDWDAVTAA